MKKLLKQNLLLLLLIVLWVIGSENVNPLFLPKPSSVFESFKILISNGDLVESIIISFWRITMATAISTIISIPLGLLITTFKILDDIITPFTNLIRFIPVTVFYPLLMMWIGLGESMKISFLFIATFFYFLPSVILCMKEIDSRLIETGYTMGMNKLQVMNRIILPYSLPSICKSILMMYGIGWTYVVIVEIINTNVGLGHLINISSARGRTDLVFVSVFTIVFISWVIDKIGNLGIKNIFKWKFAKDVD